MATILYLIKCNQYYKIGCASDAQSRLASLQTGSPFDLELVAMYEFENAEIVERALHQKFRSRNKRGEWFDLDNEAIGDLKSLCAMLDGIEKHVKSNKVSDEDELMIEEVESINNPIFDEKDFESMIADGWRCEIHGRGRFWMWRKSINGRRISRYGGMFSTLPDDYKKKYLSRESIE